MKTAKRCRHQNGQLYRVKLRHKKYRALVMDVIGVADSLTDAERRALRHARRLNHWGCEDEMYAENVEHLGTLEY